MLHGGVGEHTPSRTSTASRSAKLRRWMDPPARSWRSGWPAGWPATSTRRSRSPTRWAAGVADSRRRRVRRVGAPGGPARARSGGSGRWRSGSVGRPTVEPWSPTSQHRRGRPVAKLWAGRLRGRRAWGHRGSPGPGGRRRRRRPRHHRVAGRGAPCKSVGHRDRIGGESTSVETARAASTAPSMRLIESWSTQWTTYAPTLRGWSRPASSTAGDAARLGGARRAARSKRGVAATSSATARSESQLSALDQAGTPAPRVPELRGVHPPSSAHESRGVELDRSTTPHRGDGTSSGGRRGCLQHQVVGSAARSARAGVIESTSAHSRPWASSSRSSSRSSLRS